MAPSMSPRNRPVFRTASPRRSASCSSTGSRRREALRRGVIVAVALALATLVVGLSHFVGASSGRGLVARKSERRGLVGDR